MKPVEGFTKNTGKCKPCRAQYQRERNAKITTANSLLSLEELRAMTPKKKCSKCKETLPSTEFNRDNAKESGLQGKCRVCGNAESNAARSQYKKQNESLSLEQLRQRTPKKTCGNCKQTLSCVEFHRSNVTKSGLKDICRDCNAELSSEWAKKNPEKNRENAARYRAKKRGLFYEDFNLDQIVERDGTLACAWCGVLGDVVHMDHVRPLNLQGIHAPFNLVASCPSCNSSKRDTDPAVWLAKRLKEGWWNTPSPSALEAVRLSYSGVHEELKAQIDLRNRTSH